MVVSFHVGFAQAHGNPQGLSFDGRWFLQGEATG